MIQRPMIQKTMADKLSDKIQVVVAPPSSGGFFAAGLLGTGPAPTKTARNPKTAQAEEADEGAP